MAGFELKERETVLFPAPFEPNRRNPLIISTLRVVKEMTGGVAEMKATDIRGIMKKKTRPFIVLGLLLLICGLPLVAYAAALYIPVRNQPSFKERPPLDDQANLEDPADIKLRALAFAIAGGLPAFIGYKLVRRRRHIVYLYGTKGRLRIVAANEMQQDQLMMTLQSVQATARMQSQAGATPAPGAEGGDT